MNSVLQLGVVQDGPVAFDGDHYWNHRPMARYLKSLAQQFGQIDVYARAMHSDDPAFEQWAGMKLDPFWASVHTLPSGNKSAIGRLTRELRLFPFYYRHFQRNEWCLFFLPATRAFPGIIARRMQGRPYALYLGSDWDEIAPYTRWKDSTAYWMYFKAGQFFHRLAIEGARFVLTAGDALREKVNRSGVPAYATVPRMNLTADDIFVREDTCLGKTITCLFVGGLIPRKGLDYLIEALVILHTRRAPVELCIVGDGELRRALERRVSQLGLEDAVIMLGHVTNGPDLWQVYRDADIFVLPTEAEGFPRVLYEAMSQSLPIVTTKVSGIPYTMRDHENASLVSPGDVNALVTAIEELMSNSALRRRLIREGLRTVNAVLEDDPGMQLRDLISVHS